jgi:DNA modification methylase
MEYPDTRSEKQRHHGASFPQSLAEQQIAIFTRRGQTVLDPFVGVGTTIDACMALGRKGVGIDLNEEYAALARRDIPERRGAVRHRVIVDDARNLLKHVRKSSVDFVLTSPPYSSLLRDVKGRFAYKWQEHSTIDSIANPRPYSTDPEDFGNLPYLAFLDALADTFAATYVAQRVNTYAVWVVKDFRSLKQGRPYVNLHGDVIALAQQQGYTLWDLRIYDQTRYRPLVCLGFPSRNFYLNIGHSYLLTFKKSS